MKIKINLFAVTINQVKDLEECFKIVSEAGYYGIDLMDDAVSRWLQKGHDLQDLGELPKRYNLPVFHLGFLSEWQTHGGIPLVCRFGETAVRTSADTEEKLTREMHEFFKHASALKCEYILAPVTTENEGTVEESAENFRTLCDAAAEYNLKCGLEFVGFAKKWRTIDLAFEIVEKADHPNGGLLIDTFHFYSGNSKLEDLRTVPGEKIFVVHVNDVKDLPRKEMRDSDRVLPGEGILPLRELLSIIIKDKGYNRPLSLELFNEEYWKDDPVKIAKAGIESLEKILFRI